MSLSFKGIYFPNDVILHAVFFYLRYGVSYRDLQEIMAEQGVTVDHATLNQWAEWYAGQVAEDARRCGRPTISRIELVNRIRKEHFRPELRPLRQFRQVAA